MRDAVEIVKAFAGFRSDLDLPLGRALATRGDDPASAARSRLSKDEVLDAAVRRQLVEIDRHLQARQRENAIIQVRLPNGLTVRWDPESKRFFPASVLGEGNPEADDPSFDLLSAEEREQVAVDTADTVNHALARLFLRLGPPPTGANGEHETVPSGGGGAVQ